MQRAPVLFSNNKKGSALAFVIIIAAALAILVSAAFLMAESSIASSDSGIKSREAYLSTKSGIEFIKSRLAGTITGAHNHLISQVAIKNSNPEHEVEISSKDATLYGYGSLADGFTMNSDILENSPLYEDARIKITYSVEHQLSFVETDESTGAGTYAASVIVTATSLGKSPEASLFTDIFEKGILLTFEYEDQITANYSGGNGQSGDYIPDTDDEGPGIPVTDEWPTDEDTGETGTGLMSGGSTFVYNGSTYYVILYNTWINSGTQPSDYPHIVLINPGSARNIDGWNGVPPYNHKYLDLFNQWMHERDGGPDIQRGDKVIYNGLYYILRDDPDTISWVNAPPNYPWFIIPNQ
ncbi:MAG: hypothetical protein WCX60_08115 [Anaerovoracaceae bacterium]